VLRELISRASDGLKTQAADLERTDTAYLTRFRGANVDAVRADFLETNRIARGAATVAAFLGSEAAVPSASRLVAHVLDIVEVEYVPGGPGYSRTFAVDAILALVAVDHQGIVAELLSTLKAPQRSAETVRAAIAALGRIGDPIASDALRDFLRHWRHGWEAAVPEVVRVLVTLGDPDVLPDVFDKVESTLNTGAYSHWTTREFIAEKLAPLVRRDDRAYAYVAARWVVEKQRFDPKEDDERRSMGFAAAPNLARVLESCLLHSGRREAVEIAAYYAASIDRNRALVGTNVLADLEFKEATEALIAIIETPREYIVSYKQVHDLDGNFPDAYAVNDEQRLLAAKALVGRRSDAAQRVLDHAASDATTEFGAAVARLLGPGE
jgi:HEAT repeat protein